MTKNQWFCAKCKLKFESDRDRPYCVSCGSGYVLCNNPVPPLDARPRAALSVPNGERA